MKRNLKTAKFPSVMIADMHNEDYIQFWKKKKK